MPTFAVDVENSTYEVDAPDEGTAWKWANIEHDKQKFNPLNEMSGFDKAAAGAGKAVMDAYRGVKQFFDIGDQQKLQQEIDESRRLDAPLMDTGAGLAGNIGGNIAMMALPGASVKGLSALPGFARLAGVGSSMMAPTSIGGAAALGGAAGLLSPVATGESRAFNAGTGAIAGSVGQAIGKTLSTMAQPAGIVEPLRREAVGIMQKQGVPVNAAQATGSRFMKLMDTTFDNLPSTVGKQQAFREGQQKAFNRAILRQIGENADTATDDVLANAYKRIGGVFKDLTKGREFKIDNRFLNDLGEIEAKQRGMLPSLQSGSVKGLIDDMLEVATKGKASGEVIQQTRSELAKKASDLYRSGNSTDAHAYEQLVKSLDDLVSRGLGKAERSALRTARRQYGVLKTLEKVGAENGNISAAKFSNALKTRNKKSHLLGKTAIEQIAKAGKMIIPDKIADSGTAQRAMYQNLLTGGVGGVAGGIATGDPLSGLGYAMGGMAAPYAIRGLMYNPAGMSYLSHGALDPILNNGLLTAGGRMAAIGTPVGLLESFKQ